MTRRLGAALTPELLERLSQRDIARRLGIALPFVTVDAEGRPHPMLLSYLEVRAYDTGTVGLVIGAGTRSAGNLVERGAGTLLVIEPDVTVYVKLRMVDGSVIAVAPDSSMTMASYRIDGSGRTVRLLLTRGLLHIKSVAHPFVVSTPVGSASVGSGSADWFIKAEAGSAQVAVLAGIVDFTSNLIAESVSLPSRWGARLEAGRAPVLPRVWTQMEFNAFIQVTQ